MAIYFPNCQENYLSKYGLCNIWIEASVGICVHMLIFASATFPVMPLASSSCVLSLSGVISVYSTQLEKHAENILHHVFV